MLKAVQRLAVLGATAVAGVALTVVPAHAYGMEVAWASTDNCSATLAIDGLSNKAFWEGGYAGNGTFGCYVTLYQHGSYLTGSYYSNGQVSSEYAYSGSLAICVQQVGGSQSGQRNCAYYG
jgi:hypothetical protein